MDGTVRCSGVSAIVEHDYTAKEPDELNLIKGTILQNIKIQPGGWWEGTLANGKTGVFPDNFVRVLAATADPDDKSPVVLRDKSATVNRKCKVIYSYTQNNNDELSLAVGDIIEFLGEVEEGWWRGKLNNRTGVFPSNFVIAIESISPVLSIRKNIKASSSSSNSSSSTSKLRNSLNSSREDLVLEKDAPSLPPKPVRELCSVLFPYSPANDDELELNEGDIIAVITKELADKGWWKGELKGKVGVFPDNFVKLISPEASPSKETTRPDRPPSTTKVLNINNNKSTTRKDSFGSRDSLTESGIVSGIVSGNVAAYRKSLETRVADASAAAAGGAVADKMVVMGRKSFEKNTSAGSSTDFRKSLENLDDKKTTPPPPPVLTKKPVVPIKKSPTVSSVAGNLFSGLKQIVKSEKFSSNDSLDGAGGSKASSSSTMIGGNIPDNNDKGVICERMKKDDCEFDQVERNASILPDMRAGRAKAPKRRLPSSSASFGSNEIGNISGSSSNNSSVTYQNGGTVATESMFDTKMDSSLEEDSKNSKIRNWEKHKVPWMDELKANQAKKTSPGLIDGKSPESNKSLDLDHQNDSNEMSFDNSRSSVNFNISVELRNTGLSNTTTTTHSTSATNIEIGHTKKDSDSIMSKSMSSVMSTSAAATTTTTRLSSMSSVSTSVETTSATTGEENLKIRPSSVNLKARSISPIGRLNKSIHIASSPENVTKITPTAAAAAAPAIGPTGLLSTSSSLLSSSPNTNQDPVTMDNVCPRVIELERKVAKLEKLVQHQGQTITDLLKSLRDESDKVKTLKNELDKYAQCVTQV